MNTVIRQVLLQLITSVMTNVIDMIDIEKIVLNDGLDEAVLEPFVVERREAPLMLVDPVKVSKLDRKKCRLQFIQP
jgi:hypothetical protein